MSMTQPPPPYQPGPPAESRPWWKKKRFIIPAVIVLLFVVAGIAGGGGDEDDDGSAVETTGTTTVVGQPAVTTTGAPATTKAPAAAPAPTAAPDALAALRNMKKGTFCDNVAADVTETSGKYTARSNNSDKSPRYCIADILEQVQKAGMPAGWEAVAVDITADLKNNLGEVTKDAVVMRSSFTKDTVQRLQFNNIDKTKILTLAATKFVHPAYAKSDGS